MRTAAILTFLTFSTAAFAEPPRVAADVLPVQSLVARVMEGVGTPDLILPPGASPHGYAMRPSEAARLEEAEVVFWIGSALTPWLERPLGVVASQAEVVSLLDHPETYRIEIEEEEDEEHASGTDDHEDEAEGEAVHDDHGPVDPHAWLDPENALLWLTVIADELSRADPENAALYSGNAAAARRQTEALVAEMSTRLATARAVPFAVYHDAYRYLENRFDLQPAARLLDTEAAQPTPKRIARTRETVISEGVRNIFLEPQGNVSLVETIFDGLPVVLCQLDPMGTAIPAGPKHYWRSMIALAAAMEDCGVS